MTAASVSAYALVYALGLPDGLLAVITAIVVTQSSVGGSLKAAFDQFVGSLFGAVYATGVALAVSPDNFASSAAALILGMAPPAILAAFSPGFRIAPITAAIMLLGGAGPGVGPLGAVANRMVEVGIGCGIGLVISVFVVPARASRSVVKTAGQIADLMAEQLRALASDDTTAQATLASLAIRIREKLILLASLVQDAAREKRTWLAEVPDGAPLLRTLRRLRHDIDMLRRAAREGGSGALDARVAESWFRAAESGAASLRRIGRLLAGDRMPMGRDTLEEAVRGYRAALDEMRRDGLMRALATAALGRLFGIEFALEQLRRDLSDLAALSTEIPGR
jgi:uncharacterized membrane protein YccC